MGKCFSLTTDQRNKIRLAKLGTHASAETKAKMSLSHLGKRPCLGYKHTSEARKNMSIALMGNKNNLGHTASVETRVKMSATHLGSKNVFYGKTHTEEAKNTIRLSRLGKPTTLGRKASKETRARISQACWGISRKSETRSGTYKALWQDVEWASRRVRNIVRAIHRRPNKPEASLLELLNTYFPNEWKYVGDGSFTIGRLNPDFVNVNGKKQVIELFGTYWHQPEDEQKRKDIFSAYGFATLVIWDSELVDPKAVVTKLIQFNQCKLCQSRASRGDNSPGKCRDDTRSILSNEDSERVRA